jgi:hypothetical protein
MSSKQTAAPSKGFTIRTKTAVITTVPTYGAALAYTEKHPEIKGAAIAWGDKGSAMNFREWALIARSTVNRLQSRGLSAEALLANVGDR